MAWMTYYPHMPIGLLGIYHLLFFSARFFCKGYLQHQLTQCDEIWQGGRPWYSSLLLNFGQGLAPTRPKSEKLW